jgi:hypothetical protein
MSHLSFFFIPKATNQQDKKKTRPRMVSPPKQNAARNIRLCLLLANGVDLPTSPGKIVRVEWGGIKVE